MIKAVYKSSISSNSASTRCTCWYNDSEISDILYSTAMYDVVLTIRSLLLITHYVWVRVVVSVSNVSVSRRFFEHLGLVSVSASYVSFT